MQIDESPLGLADRSRKIEALCRSTTANWATAGNSMETWSAIKTALDALLNKLWQENQLKGASATDAFSIHCGLGETMTAEDLLAGRLHVTILVALDRPAEFTEISIQTATADPS